MSQTIRLAGLSIVVASLLQAEEFQLETIEVEETGMTTIVKDVAGEEVRSADLADALHKIDPDVQLIRRSGIANDIILRGMRKDDINVLIDGGKIYGGCPNRMDPPLSHVLSNNVDNIVIKEGPYDVEHFGTLTGLVEVDTLKPSREMEGRIDFNVGSWNYYKLGAQFSGGNDRIRLMVGGSTEKGGQYEDGDGHTLADQVDNFAKTNPALLNKYRFTPEYHDMDAFEKKTGMVKLFVDVADNQALQLSYTVNQSDGVLYPNTPMDALEDNSNLFHMKYTMRNLSEWSKKLELKFYNSWVYHPMGNYYRYAANGPHGVIENVMHSRIYGGTIKNTMDLYGGELALGLDASRRTWNGEYRHHDGETWSPSIDHSKTKDWALFTEYKKRIDAWDFDAGVRYDDATAESDEPGTDEN
ncbi:TonB-dependent receptor domain-containing protein, partial [Hydrogenimonas sp.]